MAIQGAKAGPRIRELASRPETSQLLHTPVVLITQPVFADTASFQEFSLTVHKTLCLGMVETFLVITKACLSRGLQSCSNPAPRPARSQLYVESLSAPHSLLSLPLALKWSVRSPSDVVSIARYT